MRHHDDLKRSLRGAVWGLAATVVMTAVMVVGALVFPSSFARPPFPYLFINHLLPHASGAAAAAVTVIAHFAYGALMGMLFAFFSEPMTLGKGRRLRRAGLVGDAGALRALDWDGVTSASCIRFVRRRRGRSSGTRWSCTWSTA